MPTHFICPLCSGPKVGILSGAYCTFQELTVGKEGGFTFWKALEMKFISGHCFLGLFPFSPHKPVLLFFELKARLETGLPSFLSAFSLKIYGF